MSLYKNYRLSTLLFPLFLFTLPFLSACQKQSQESFEWRLQSQATASSIDYIELVEFTNNVKTMSNGRLEITPYPGGELARGGDIYTAVRDGKVEMGNGWPNWWSAQDPAWAVMNAGPFDFMNLDASMMFFLAGEGTELANQLSMPDGVIWRAAWWPGMEFGLLSKDPITGLADLKEKRVRIGPGLPSEVLSVASGSYSIPLAPEEIRSALENDQLDAVEWTTTSGAWNLGLQDISPNAIVPAVWQPSVLSDFLINKQAYDELPPDLQAILETAIRAYTLTTTMKAKVQDIEALEKFKSQGTNIRTWSDEDIARWREANDGIVMMYKNKDSYTKRLIESKKDFKRRYNEYYEIFGPYE
jgi:TRAP-type mannitol/chloroaromatic compound transport system substrate-binding protein